MRLNSDQPNTETKPRSQRGNPMLRAGVVTSAMTFLSRISGLVRDTVIGQVFGAQAVTDAFLIAFRIPNLFRRFFAEGAFSQAFVPVFTEYREQRSPAELRDLTSHIIGTLGAVLLLVTTLGVASAPLLALAFAPGLSDDPERLALVQEMLAITFPYLFFISLVACAGGILNSYKRFAVSAFTPIWLNLCLIAAAWWLSPLLAQPVVALAWGVLIAGIVQLLFQLPFVLRLGMVARPRWNWHHPGVVRIRQLMLPALFGSSVAQINMLLNTVIASFLAVGSVSWLYFADRMVEFPLGIFGVTLATVILPNLSSHHAKADAAGFSAALDWGLRIALTITLPAMFGLLLLAQPILATVFEYRQFTAHDTHMAGYSLMAYSLGLPAFILIKILASSFFSRQDTKTPVRFAVVSMIANMLLNLALVIPMYFGGFVAPHMGLALAAALSAWLQALLLLRRLHQDHACQLPPGWAVRLTRILLACLLMSLTLWWLRPDADQWSSWSFHHRGLELAKLVGLGAVSYALGLYLLGLRKQDLLE